jgi:UDP-N-acetyl-D-glucosamine dehydrogenase
MQEDGRSLRERVETADARVAVVGLGYVGLPVAVAFAEAGFLVVGVDVDKERVRTLESGKSHLLDVPTEQVARLRKAGRLRATSSYRRLAAADVILICVPTPLREGVPDLSMVVAAATAIARVMKNGTLVVLESTTYPGTTEELVRPLLERGEREGGRDFLLAYSPERIDPGNPIYSFADIPKIVGGITEDSTRTAAALYGHVVPKVVTVTGTREAELAKLIENTFRHVNIGLVNELAVYAHEMGVDIWEAIEAAASKPFGYMPFWPGPGWGGHCIPLDPAYLSWRVRRDRAHEVRFVELAHAVNSEMPRHVVERASLLLNDRGKPLRNSRILGIGVAYKRGTQDTRESPAVKVLEALAKRGADVSYHDPLVPRLDVKGANLTSSPLTQGELRRQDMVIVLAPQVGVNWSDVAHHAKLIFDCCNAIGKGNGTIVRL